MTTAADKQEAASEVQLEGGQDIHLAAGVDTEVTGVTVEPTPIDTSQVRAADYPIIVGYVFGAIVRNGQATREDAEAAIAVALEYRLGDQP